MSKDYRARVVPQRSLHDFARIDARLREGTSKQLLAFDQVVLRIEKHRDEQLVLAVGKPRPQVGSNVLSDYSARH